MSGVMKPFDTLLGVVTRRWSSRRALMLPSLLATKPRAYKRRPTSTMSARTCSSARVLTYPCFRTSLRARYSSRHLTEQKQLVPSESAESRDTYVPHTGSRTSFTGLGSREAVVLRDPAESATML